MLGDAGVVEEVSIKSGGEYPVNSTRSWAMVDSRFLAPPRIGHVEICPPKPLGASPNTHTYAHAHIHIHINSFLVQPVTFS